MTFDLKCGRVCFDVGRKKPIITVSKSVSYLCGFFHHCKFTQLRGVDKSSARTAGAATIPPPPSKIRLTARCAM